ncbi:hypothetical protein T492DRAFT_1085073 [Pavlovales sp. CCMP2436]|nr:hypothetical protein T492DRAFT_1085073 [Pavlovales sp. CCMP2436]
MVAREVPALASLCLASVARHPTRALGRVRALPVDRRCFEQLMAALKGDTHVTDELLLLLLRPGVAEFDLAGCVQVTDAGLRAAAARLTSVEIIDLSELGVSDEALSAMLGVPARLTALRLRRCRRLGDGAARMLGRRCLSTLVELSLAMCKQVTSAGVAAVLEHGGRELRHLDLSGLPKLADDCYTPGSSACDATLGALHTLRLAQCRLLTDVGLAAIFSRARSLRTADTSGTAAAELFADAIAEACSSLFALELAGCATMPAEALTVVLVGCLQLRTLVLSRCCRVSHLAFHHSSHSLRALDLSFCLLEHAALLEVASNCPELVSLALRGCAQLRDESVLELCTRCPELEAVDLGHCPLLTDYALYALAARCANLSELRVDGSALLTDEAVGAVVEACPLLSLLSLAHCTQVSGQALLTLARHSHFLRELDVSYCAALGEGALVHLARHAGQLETLRAACCAWLSPAGLELIVESCSLLRKLDVARCPQLGLDEIARILRRTPIIVDLEMGL